MNQPTFLIVDLFCGAGGTTTGFEMTGGIAKVIACVNHDPLAIESHWKNHPNVVHFEEDIRTLKLHPLRDVVNMYRRQYPHALLVLWASLECTNFSKAKGGLPRDADSRTLADHLDRYIKAIEPDYVQIENVVEFMSWGPLDANGKPLSKKNGEDFMRWRSRLCGFGYRDDWRELNSADFGAYTSRNRLFGAFARPHLPIAWPAPSHAKKVNKGGMFGQLQPWQPVKHVLDFADEGESIFSRKKPLVEKTLERIYAGLVKYVAGGERAFMLKYNSMSQQGKYVPPGIHEPSPVISTQGRIGLVQAAFIQKHFSGRPAGKVVSVNGPTGALTTSANQSLVQSKFIQSYYGNGFASSMEQPCPTLTTKDRQAVVTIDRKWHYLMNPQYFNNGGSVDAPCFTLIARMDKMPPYLITTDTGHMAIEVFETDSPMMVKIKEFMAMYGIVDIKMRMLKVPELLKIQGFPHNYTLSGSQADQKKFIGNSVVPIVPKVWAEAMHASVEQLRLKMEKQTA
jgi:DNA (cytosine-5)-methyltransferase 1